MLGHDLLIKPSGYWTEENTLKDLKIEIEKIGHFPTQKELRQRGRDDLYAAITKNGGTNKFRKSLGYELLQKPPGYWNDETIIKELKSIISEIGHFPSQPELSEMERGDLEGAISIYGGANKFRNILGYELLKKPVGYWKDNTLISELKQIIAELGHFPSHTDLKEIDRQDINGAFGILGGSQKFRELLGYVLPHKPAGYWNEETVIKELKPYIKTNKYFPPVNELRNNSSLVAAIFRYGGIDYFRKIYGFPPSIEDNIKMSGYVSRRGRVSEKIIKKVLIRYCRDNGVPEPLYDQYVADHKKLEFLLTVPGGRMVGIDVTNTKTRDGSIIKQKYELKKYQNHVDELWVVVFSNVFSDEQYSLFNKNSPDNVKILSAWDLIDELQIEIDERTVRRFETLDECTQRNKNELINRLKNRTLGEYF